MNKSARKVYNDIYLNTNDKIIKRLARCWIINNSYYVSVYNLFGIKIRKHFRIKIEKRISKSTGKINTLYRLSCGILGTTKFILRECC